MKKRILLGLSALALALVLFGALVAKGAVTLNHPSREDYPVRGVDVSHYQGNVDFGRLWEQGIQFAFIKATEGSSHVDPCFPANLAAVQDSPLCPGFYHFFSYDSPGQDQAEHFIAQVPRVEGMLPPVIDVEFYGDKALHPPAQEQVQPQLRDMADALEAAYGVKPILYCTQRAYRLYVKGAFDDCDLWIRSVYFRPFIDQKWIFWQYTDQAELDGYDGVEPAIDLNVFAGTQAEFDAYPRVKND